MWNKCKLIRKFLILLFIGIAIIGLFSVSRYNYTVNIDYVKLETSKISGRIYINGTSGWIAFKNDGNCTGEGTYSEPYIIEDLVIEGSLSSCIWIENSNVYFKIKNCTLLGASHSGIRLSNVSNSIMINNTCSTNSYGIYLSTSSNNFVSGNLLNINDNGITLMGCDENIIAENVATSQKDLGIYVYGSDNNDLLDNTVSSNRIGIQLEQGTNNNITGNIVNNNYGQDGISLWWSSDNNNLVGNIANENSDNGIYIANSIGNTVSGNTANYNLGENGIKLWQASNNDLEENIANNNFIAGINLIYSDNNEILGNTANNNEYGIQLDNSDYNIVSSNTLCGNTEDIYENSCEGNTFQGNGCGDSPGIPGYIIILLVGVTSVISGILIHVIRKQNRK